MGSHMVLIDETVVAFGASSYAVVERIEIVIRGASDYTVTRPGSERILIARVVRRGLSRRTATCTVTVVNEPQRLIVAIRGEIEAYLVDQLRAAATGRSREPMVEMDVVTPAAVGTSPTTSIFSPTSIGPPPGMVPSEPNSASPARLSGGVSERRSKMWMPPPARPPHSPAPVIHAPESESELTIIRPSSDSHSTPRVAPGVVSVIAVSDGRRIEVAEVVLFGRDPSPRANEPTGTLIRVDDALVSKTHLAIGRHGEQLWAEDRGSVNGSLLADKTGRTFTLEPERRVLLTAGSSITIGDTTLTYAINSPD